MQLYLKGTLTQVYSCEYCKIFKNIYFDEHLRSTASDMNLWMVVSEISWRRIQNPAKHLSWIVLQLTAFSF